MFERLTDRARKVMFLANLEAQRFNHGYVGSQHILLGLLREGSGTGAEALANLGRSLSEIKRAVENLMKSGPEMVIFGKLPLTPRAKKVVEYATEETRDLNHNHVGYVGTEHLLLGLMREQDGVAARALNGLGLTEDRIRSEVLNCISRKSLAGANATNASDAETKDLSVQASPPPSGSGTQPAFVITNPPRIFLEVYGDREPDGSYTVFCCPSDSQSKKEIRDDYGRRGDRCKLFDVSSIVVGSDLEPAMKVLVALMNKDFGGGDFWQLLFEMTQQAFRLGQKHGPDIGKKK